MLEFLPFLLFSAFPNQSVGQKTSKHTHGLNLLQSMGVEQLCLPIPFVAPLFLLSVRVHLPTLSGPVYTSPRPV